MPLYDYKCSKCDNDWETFKKMSARDVPVQEPCPNCGRIGFVRRLLTYGGIADPVLLGKIKPPPGFTSVLKRIASEHPEHTMKIRD